MRKARRIRHAVVVVANRVDAGAVAIARTFETIEGPQVVLADRETGRAVTLDLVARQILEDQLGEIDVGEESGRVCSLARS